MPILDELHDIVDRLEHKASLRRNKEVDKANAFYEGYMQGCEDFRRNMAQLLIEEANKEKQQ